METCLRFAQGPLFAATFTFLIAGLARHVLLQSAQITESVRRLTDPNLAVGRNLRAIGEWLVPVNHLYRNRSFVSIASFLFHVGLLITPLFLVNHVALWKGFLGFAWPAISPAVADVLTLVTIAGALILLGFRAFSVGGRALSSVTDYLLLVAMLVPFCSGFMAMHPSVNPFSYSTMFLIHVLSSEVLFVLIPTTELSHCVLFPFVRFSSDLFWRMPAGASERVARELHGEDLSA